MLLRAISLPAHGALELTAGLAVGILPLALGLGPVAIAVGVFAGAVMVGLALGASVPLGERTLPVAAHAAYDRIIAAALLAVGAGAAIAGNLTALTFFAVAGALYAALIAATRYTRTA